MRKDYDTLALVIKKRLEWLTAEIGIDGQRIRAQVQEHGFCVFRIRVADVSFFSVEYHRALGRGVDDKADRLAKRCPPLIAKYFIKSRVDLVCACDALGRFHYRAVEIDDGLARGFLTSGLRYFRHVGIEPDAHEFAPIPLRFQESSKIARGHSGHTTKRAPKKEGRRG